MGYAAEAGLDATGLVLRGASLLRYVWDRTSLRAAVDGFLDCGGWAVPQRSAGRMGDERGWPGRVCE